MGVSGSTDTDNPAILMVFLTFSKQVFKKAYYRYAAGLLFSSRDIINPLNTLPEYL